MLLAHCKYSCHESRSLQAHGLSQPTVGPRGPAAIELGAQSRSPDMVYLVHPTLRLLIACLAACPGVMCGSVFITACLSLAWAGCRSLLSAIFDRGANACLQTSMPLGRCLLACCPERIANSVVKDPPGAPPPPPSPCSTLPPHTAPFSSGGGGYQPPPTWSQTHKLLRMSPTRPKIRPMDEWRVFLDGHHKS